MNIEEWTIYFAKQDQEKLHKESNNQFGLETNTEFWQMSQVEGVYKLLVR